MSSNVALRTFVAVAALTVLHLPVESGMPTKITSIEGITEYELDNGVKILLFPDPSKPTVTVNMTVFVGSRHEGYGEAGMAHLLEHMLFKGTPDHQNIPKALQDRGARFNGTTWLDRTNYYETLPASDDNLEFAIRLEADRLINSTVKAEDLASEFSVVRNEFERGENNPSRILFQKIVSAAFDWHNYGKSTIGNRADIERVPIDNLRAFYRKYYQPDNVMVVVAGRFDNETALNYVNKYFGSIERPERELPQTYTIEPDQDGERLVTLRRVGNVNLVGTLYHIPSGAHPDFVPIDVLESVLTAAPAGRLYKALVETRKAASISGGAFALHDAGMIRFMAEVAPEVPAENVLETMIDIVEGIGDTEITKDEVERARERLLKIREQSSAESANVAIELSEWAAQGDWRLYFLYRDRLEKVTVEQVQAVAKKYFLRSNRTAGLFIPTESPARVSVPPTPDLAEMIGDYKGRAVADLGEAFDVTPANIDRRTEVTELSTGLKVALLPKDTRGDTVKLQLNLRYGNLQALQNKGKAAELLGSMLMRGTEKLTRQEFQDELNKNRIQMSASGIPGVVSFNVQTTREKLPAALKLLTQAVREPAFPENELETLKQARISAYEQQKSDPSALASVTVSRAMSPYEPGDPRYVATPAEEVELTKAVSIGDIRSLYEDYVNGQVGELSVVGDFDPAEILSAFESMLGDWKQQHEFARLPRTGDVDIEGREVTIDTPDKPNATYFAGTVFPMRDDHPDYPALVIGNFVLGAGSLSSRLGNRVRQQEGLSYGVASTVRANAIDERTIFYMYAIANPANVPQLKSVMIEEAQRLLKEGVTEEELAAAKSGYLQKAEVTRTQDASLARSLANNLFVDRTMAFTGQQEEQIRDLTKAEVDAALRKYIDLKKLVIAVAADTAQIKGAE